jgi:sugar lactone lactonase YvrE
VYVGAITRPSDIGAKAPALSRVASWLAGATPGPAELAKPFGLAIDAQGDILVTDTGANAVCCLDRARKKWLRWDQVGKTRFQSPVAIARHRDTIFVADSGLGKVLAFGENGKAQFEITRELERPSGLAVSGERIYVSDTQLHQVVVYDVRGVFLNKFGKRGTGEGEFNFPTHVAVDSKGLIYITDSLNCRVQVFDAEGKFQRSIGSAGDTPGHFSRPKGVATDTAGHVYIVDAMFDNVQVFDEQGQLLLNWGQNGTEPGQFWLPNAIAISRDNEIYVADSYNRRIQVFQYTGKQ